MKRLLMAAVFLSPCSAPADPLGDAEVRLPYLELRRLLDEGKDVSPAAETLPPALGAARMKVLRAGGQIAVEATFRTLSFTDAQVLVPLVGGTVSLDADEAMEVKLLVRDGRICHAAEAKGTSTFTVRLLGDGPELTLDLPPCPSLLVETDETGLLVNERPLTAGQTLPLPAAGGPVTLRALSTREAEEASRPPQPSDWSWQFQVLVREDEGELVHVVSGRASATGGSGLSAGLRLPADAREVSAQGSDLASQRTGRDADGTTRLNLKWKSRDLLEREIVLSYRRPLRPLDSTWQLATPMGTGALQTRFLIAANPRRAFEAAGLAGPFDAGNLPAALREALAGSPYFTLEGKDGTTPLQARELPLVATADAVIPKAAWFLQQEVDGSRLIEGVLEVEHRQPLRIALESPAGATLLNCSVNGRETRPVDRGDGRIEIPLPPGGESTTKLQLSFTAAGDPLDPVSGTLSLALPRTPVFIHSLSWRIDLPAAYRSEVNGNLTRTSLESGDPGSAIRLGKNLCRDEVPAVAVFYQRADLTTTR
ncbi:hypothetical protein [Luteolibacter marinus]|uniref:hypothetical protein n=1 Tax=Luteolibacter marinus TaxID=2776705 RepID=UPI001868F536|nr:hypothetical protein [Luteolibacter marinus]